MTAGTSDSQASLILLYKNMKIILKKEKREYKNKGILSFFQT